jgi:hypothetical protein
MAVDLSKFTMSFQQGIVKLNDKQYTSIGNISATQSVDRSPVYGTGARAARQEPRPSRSGRGQPDVQRLARGAPIPR